MPPEEIDKRFAGWIQQRLSNMDNKHGHITLVRRISHPTVCIQTNSKYFLVCRNTKTVTLQLPWPRSGFLNFKRLSVYCLFTNALTTLTHTGKSHGLIRRWTTNIRLLTPKAQLAALAAPPVPPLRLPPRQNRPRRLAKLHLPP